MGDTEIDTMTNVTLGQYNFDDDAFKSISDKAKDFIRCLLVKDGKYVFWNYILIAGNVCKYLHVYFRTRMSAKDALIHPWLIHSAFNTELSLTKSKLKRYVIKKRWIKAVNTIIALKRMGAKIDLELV